MRNKWENLTVYFQEYPEDIRRVIYSTNHRQFRTFTKTKEAFQMMIVY